MQAGASIVADNMQGLDSAGVNAMVPGCRLSLVGLSRRHDGVLDNTAQPQGSRVDCIIGSASIRDFSTATEVLQGKAWH